MWEIEKRNEDYRKETVRNNERGGKRSQCIVRTQYIGSH